MVRVGVIGASGYTGVELLRLLTEHGEVHVTYVTSKAHAGRNIASLFPNLRGCFDAELSSFEVRDALDAAELLFLALPHGESQKVIADLLGQSAPESRGVRIIDLSGDFRLKNAAAYTRWYKMDHVYPQLLGKVTYGLPELYGDRIKKAMVIANPGCYPTGAILALAPLLKEGLVREDSVIVDSKSGVSGAGKQPTAKTHFCQVGENTKAYGLGFHRHTPEIEQELSALAGSPVMVSFTPHLIPMNRGILSTCYASLKGQKRADLQKVYQVFYRDHPFVKVLGSDELPETKYVLGTNYCHIAPRLDERTGWVTVVSAIDNLGKGAAGQAIHNMNLMFGFEEEKGLKRGGIFP